MDSSSLTYRKARPDSPQCMTRTCQTDIFAIQPQSKSLQNSYSYAGEEIPGVQQLLPSSTCLQAPKTAQKSSQAAQCWRDSRKGQLQRGQAPASGARAKNTSSQAEVNLPSSGCQACPQGWGAQNQSKGGHPSKLAGMQHGAAESHPVNPLRCSLLPQEVSASKSPETALRETARATLCSSALPQQS